MWRHNFVSVSIDRKVVWYSHTRVPVSGSNLIVGRFSCDFCSCRLYNDLVSFASPTFQQANEIFGQATFATAVRSGGKVNLINRQSPASFKPNGQDVEVGKPLTNQREEVSKPSSTSNKNKNKARDPKTGKSKMIVSHTSKY